VQFPAWLFLSLFAFTYLLSCALKLNDDDDDDDDSSKRKNLKSGVQCRLQNSRSPLSIFLPAMNDVYACNRRLTESSDR